MIISDRDANPPEISQNPQVVLLNPKCTIPNKANFSVLEILVTLEIIIQGPIQP